MEAKDCEQEEIRASERGLITEGRGSQRSPGLIVRRFGDCGRRRKYREENDPSIKWRTGWRETSLEKVNQLENYYRNNSTNMTL